MPLHPATMLIAQSRKTASEEERSELEEAALGLFLNRTHHTPQRQVRDVWAFLALASFCLALAAMLP